MKQKMNILKYTIIQLNVLMHLEFSLRPISTGGLPTKQWTGISPETPKTCNHLPEDTFLPTSGPAATEQGRVWQPTGPSLAYQHTHNSWPCHSKRAHTLCKYAIPRAYSSGDQRKVCCWAPYNVSHIKLLLQYEE